jgi:hypothetical protein
MLEEQFALVYRLNFDYASVLRMPLTYRKWFIDRYLRLIDDKQKENS